MFWADSECKIANIFRVSPLNATGEDLQRPPDSPTAQRFFSSLRLPKNWHPKKLLSTTLSCPLSCGLFFKSHCHCLIVSCSVIDIKIILSHSCAGYNDTLSHQQYAQRKKSKNSPKNLLQIQLFLRNENRKFWYLLTVMFCKHIFGNVIFFISKTNLGCVKTPFW